MAESFPGPPLWADQVSPTRRAAGTSGGRDTEGPLGQGSAGNSPAQAGPTEAPPERGCAPPSPLVEWTAVSEAACGASPGDPGAADGALLGECVPGDRPRDWGLCRASCARRSVS